MSYDHKKIDKKWQKKWFDEQVFKTDLSKPKEKTLYCLDMFPYPSGEGLHVGHPRGYIATDVYSRMKRMQGYAVLHPMGWDAFGLPAENYAIKNKVHPGVAVSKNVARFKEQLNLIGLSYDWDREINTTDPRYYKFTQWIFLQIFKAGLAYESNEPINWCPNCKTGLANEDLENGLCERCGSTVEKKPIRQWVLKITEYADKLLDGLEELKLWPESIKESQRNWIGKSDGVKVKFKIVGSTEVIEVFTTRPDTLFGVTYLVLAPENKLLDILQSKIENFKEVDDYRQNSSKSNEIDRTNTSKEKTGIMLQGIEAINPINSESIPVFVADYVLGNYGTGAVMAVPGHDERDHQFATKFNLPIKYVISEDDNTSEKSESSCFTGNGVLKNSGEWSGRENISSGIEMAIKVGGEIFTNYKLKDWVFSRQRYWGEPIPLIHCLKCGVVPVPEKDLPVELPEVKNYEPTGTGESPLANIDSWVNVSCPLCSEPAKRETNTMPQWAGSCWYYLRFADPHNQEDFIGQTVEDKFLPVDLYVGGAEHATRHLIYARFWHRFLYDKGFLKTAEPFMRLQNQGLIGGSDGRKMSKRWGNVINPDDVIAQYGADTLRLYEMFMGPFNQGISWNTESMVGSRRFLERVYKFVQKTKDIDNKVSLNSNSLINKTIKKVEDDIENFSFNTAISELMKLLNHLETDEGAGTFESRVLIRLLAPFAPHLCEELWQMIGENGSIVFAEWPTWDMEAIKSGGVKIAVQINGKAKSEIEIPFGSEEKFVLEEALKDDKISEKLKREDIKKVIYVQNRIINLLTQ